MSGLADDSTLIRSLRFFLLLKTFQFINKNRHAEIAGLHTLGDTDFEYFHDLFHTCTELQRRLDVPGAYK